MPSRDLSGKRLAGSGFRKQRAERGLVPRPSLGSAPIPSAFLAVQEPPTEVEAIEAWAAGLNLRAGMACLLANQAEIPRIYAVTVITRELGKLKDKAARAEKAMKLRRIRLGELVEVNLDCPPYSDPIAIVVWAGRKLAQLAYEAATAENWQPDPRILAAAKTLSGTGFLPCNAELRALTERLNKV